MISKFIFLLDFFLANNTYEQIICKGRNHSFLAVKYASQCIKRNKQQKQTLKDCLG